MTWKKVILRGLLGIAIGIALSYTISIIISLMNAGSEFFAYVPELEAIYGSEKGAALAQYVYSAVLGFTFAASSALFEIEHWSMRKQTAVHFIITSTVYMPVAVLSRWVSLNVLSILGYFGVWLVVYIGIWFFQYSYWKNRLKPINEKLQKTSDSQKD